MGAELPDPIIAPQQSPPCRALSLDGGGKPPLAAAVRNGRLASGSTGLLQASRAVI